MQALTQHSVRLRRVGACALVSLSLWAHTLLRSEGVACSFGCAGCASRLKPWQYFV